MVCEAPPYLPYLASRQKQKRKKTKFVKLTCAVPNSIWKPVVSMPSFLSIALPAASSQLKKI